MSTPHPAGSRYCAKCGQSTSAAQCPVDGAPTFARDGNSSAVLQLAQGNVIAGKYRVHKRLGRGGFGAVYAAEQMTTGQQVAIKVLAIDPDDADDSVIQRFLQEAQVTARLKHPNTIRVFDFGQADDGALFIVLELLNGPTLEQVLKDNEKAGRTMSEREALGIAVPILRSLAEAHDAGLVHRDLKPLNIMLTDSGDDEPVVKVLDFGIARKQDSALTGTGKALGTPSYMSPEQCRGGTLDGRSDLYAIGILLYRCVAGRLPFENDNPLAMLQAHIHERQPDVRKFARLPLSDAFVACLDRALAKSPADRYQSARAMRIELEGVLGGAWGGTPLRSLPAVQDLEPVQTRAMEIEEIGPTLTVDIGDTRLVDTGSQRAAAPARADSRTNTLAMDAHDAPAAPSLAPRAEPRASKIVPAIAGLALLAAAAVAAVLFAGGPKCGDGTCAEGESTASCLADCTAPVVAAPEPVKQAAIAGISASAKIPVKTPEVVVEPPKAAEPAAAAPAPAPAAPQPAPVAPAPIAPAAVVPAAVVPAAVNVDKPAAAAKAPRSPQARVRAKPQPPASGGSNGVNGLE